MELAVTLMESLQVPFGYADYILFLTPSIELCLKMAFIFCSQYFSVLLRVLWNKNNFK